MKVLKFNLSGKTAFFKRPDVNSVIYFTYGCIHKIAIMGIIGSCLGLKGYNQQNEEDYPEFYEKLNHLKIGIVPKNKDGYVSKKIHTYNNGTTFCNKGSDGYGANLIVREQWLEDPSWDIYILLENHELSSNIQNRFTESKFIYIPYLGKNDHVANITDVEVISEVKVNENFNRIDSLFIKNEFEVRKINSDYDEVFKFQESLPYNLENLTNQYILESFMFTNMFVDKKDDVSVYKVGNLNIQFI